jgi:uncharacterized protein YciW
VIAGLARLVTEAPWTLRRDDLTRARAAGLDEASVLHVIVLSAFFGYLNRVADAVGIELDYEVAEPPPPADAATLALPRPDADERPDLLAPRPLELEMRPGAAELFAGWRAHVMERDAPLPRAQRLAIAAVVADATGENVELLALPPALHDYADIVARAPWRLGAEALAPLRTLGLDDAALFDVIQVAAYQSFASRLAVALAALAR